MNSTTQAATPATTDSKISLAELEADVIAKLIADGATQVTAEDIARHGDSVVASGALRFYTAERWSGGRWISKKVLDRVQKAVKTQAPQAEAKPEPAPTKKTRSRKTAAAA